MKWNELKKIAEAKVGYYGVMVQTMISIATRIRIIRYKSDGMGKKRSKTEHSTN